MEQINLQQLASTLGGPLVNTTEHIIKPVGVSIDTREDMRGKIFIPLKGGVDGHMFLSQAFEKGAVLAISRQSIDFPHIKVSDTFSAIKAFAKFYKKMFNIPTVGITGSVGKTTTKDLTASVLGQGTVKTQGNFNNEIGLPLTVFNINNTTQTCVLEMGMNNLGEIHNLADIARPDIALITNIGVAHIENLGSRKNILKAKTEIFDYNPNHIILDGDNDMLATLKGTVKALFYYLNQPEQDYTAYNINHNGLLGTTATIKILKDQFTVNIPIPGEYMVRNALAGAIVGKILGRTTEQIQQGIATFKPSKNRMDIITKGQLTIINDTYNASPQSMKAMLDLLSNQQGKKIAILGDMFELGDFAPKLHKEVGDYAKKTDIDNFIAVGPLAKDYGGDFYFETKEDFFESCLAKSFGEATVLVKASRGMEFEKIVDYLKFL
ncbi:MAG: UDP-N-acetylmuramoyl-tripeptide--D-alanyl-D-alanine ligase [Defluviitaleaceae bacterium]|nr:UDP-N-acetylmuramoyl-tripeptide--D-alanyl-D-alanine ligase [Defluviitaleaceae bacterium]